jgi:raffinose/stachyose/melibiose transport system substrate-binding protein
LIETYYNRALLKRIGASVPKTLNDFSADLAKAKAAGITPIAMGNVEQVGMTTPLFSAMNALGSHKTITNIIYSHGSSKISQPSSGFPQAVRTLSSWADKGYFTSDFGGVAVADAAQSFVDGKALFHFDYSGSLPLKPGQAKEFGSFLLPRNDGKPAVATLASSTNFSVSAKCAHPDAAAAFLDFAASPAAAQIATNLGTDPMLDPHVKVSGSDPLFANDIANINAVVAHDTGVAYLDWATPTLLQTLEVKMQDLFAGKTDVSGVVSAVQADTEKFRKTNG